MDPQPTSFSTIGITGKPGDPAVTELLGPLLPLLQQRGCRVLIDASSIAANGPDDSLRCERDALIAACGLVIAIGGDGTLIHIARALALAGRDDVALMGINRGRLGFLVDIAPDRLSEIERVLDGEAVLDPRLMLTVEVRRNADDAVLSSSVAINEVAIHRWNTSRMVELSTWINGKPLSDHRSDGLIVATPTGSTAYAMASGGPIAHPNLHAMVLTPICPHTLSNRPLVVDSSSRIEIQVHSGFTEQVRVSCDSQVGLTLADNSRVVVAAHPTPLRLVHPPGYSYFELLRAKLGWGGPPRNHVSNHPQGLTSM